MLRIKHCAVLVILTVSVLMLLPSVVFAVGNYDGYRKNSVGLGLAINSEKPNLPTYSVNTLEPLTTKAASGSCPTVLPASGNAGRAFHNDNVSGNYVYSQACAVKPVNN